MHYTLVRYWQTPDEIVDIAATSDPAEAVELVKQWSRCAPDEGLILSLGDSAIIHRMPRSG